LELIFVQTIYLDISNKGVMPRIHAKQGDVGRKFRAVLIDGGYPYNIPESVAFSVWYDGDSGEGNYTHIGDKSAFSIDGNRVDVELIEQMVSVDGKTTACLVISDENGNQVATWNIEILVEGVPGFGSPSATEYFTAFSQTAAQVKADADRAEEAAGTFKLDKTLTVNNAAADAGTVGKRLASLQDAIDEKQDAGDYLDRTDTTLSESGVAADAATVGEKINDVKNLPRLVFSETGERPSGLRNGDFWAKPVEG
jgi:hypothetical protein